MRFRPFQPKQGPLLWAVAATALLGLLLPAGLGAYTLWGAATLAYEITPDEVLIVYGPSTSRIKRAAIVSARVIDQPSRARRVAGTSIPGHYQGRWSFTETGPITLYATSLEGIVVLETAARTWGISPDDAGAFLAALESGGTGRFAPVPSDDVAGFAVLAFLPLLLAVGAGAMIAYVLRIRRNLGYELTSRELVIHGGWKPVSLPYRNIGGVEVAEPVGVPRKAYAVSMPGLYWGSFTWMQVAPRVKLYATRLRPLVVIECGGETYGLSPDKPEAFVAALKERLRR